ncbi:MAG: sodium:proton antiporter [Holosporales bacterium]|nr:sodium:proton antiporter [Holosporales bacterium]
MYTLSEVIVLSAPLATVLLMLAFMPLAVPKFWSRYEWVVLPIISAISIICSYLKLPDFQEVMQGSLVEDYLPFIIMVLTLYVLSHGIQVRLSAPPSTLANSLFLGIGSIFASLIGTTGASMLFLPSFLTMNKDRQHKSHLVIFFIFLMANIGGMLTPLGDAPILLGYLHGVGFSWSIIKLFPIWVVSTAGCLLTFYFIDRFFLRRELIENGPPSKHSESELLLGDTEHRSGVYTDVHEHSSPGAIQQEADCGGEQSSFSLSVSGWVNVALLAITVVTLFVEFHSITVGSITIPHMLIRNVILIALTVISLLRSRPCKIDFSPFADVAKTFLVIFITIAPVVSILVQNSEAIHAFMMRMAAGSDGTSVYFWLCSLTSAFLDNAPSYLLFFNIAGGNADELVNAYPHILIAISSSSVIMGTITYIGNAPNLMIRSIAEKRGIKMPSFLGYMVWAVAIILPIGYLLPRFIRLLG